MNVVLLLQDLIVAGRKFQYAEIATLGLRCIKRLRGVENLRLSDEFLVVLSELAVRFLSNFSASLFGSELL